MKKLYTIASTLLLSMSMALMTSCSSDNDLVNDKPVLPEQGARTVTLKATADMSGESRVAVEGVEGKEDAFRITGWKNGDVVKVLALALKEDGSGAYNDISFTYNASTETFTGTVPPEFDLSELKYAYVGGSFRKAKLNPKTKKWDNISISTPIAISNPEDCFLFGNVSVDGESISANLSAPYALACVHNNTSADIEVGQIRNTNDYFYGLSYSYESTASSFTLTSGSTFRVGDAEKFTVPAGQKAYFVIPPKNEDGNNYYGLYDFTNEKVIAAPKENITLGKVYKVQVYPPTTGTAKATIGGSEVDVNWVQLWAGGPKFAEYNVGASSVGEYGGYYTWGATEEMTTSNYNQASQNVDGIQGTSDDTAMQIWGSNWQMPSKTDYDNLLANCTVTNTDNYNNTGTAGLIFTGKDDYASNSVFFPTAGFKNRGEAATPDPSFYWSSDYDSSSSFGYCLFVQVSSSTLVTRSINTWMGSQVRAIIKE